MDDAPQPHSPRAAFGVIAVGVVAWQALAWLRAPGIDVQAVSGWFVSDTALFGLFVASPLAELSSVSIGAPWVVGVGLVAAVLGWRHRLLAILAPTVVASTGMALQLQHMVGSGPVVPDPGMAFVAGFVAVSLVGATGLWAVCTAADRTGRLLGAVLVAALWLTGSVPDSLHQQALLVTFGEVNLLQVLWSGIGPLVLFASLTTVAAFTGPPAAPLVGQLRLRGPLDIACLAVCLACLSALGLGWWLAAAAVAAFLVWRMVKDGQGKQPLLHLLTVAMPLLVVATMALELLFRL